MGKIARKSIKKVTVSEMITTLTKSLAFQVNMILWEDREKKASCVGENKVIYINRMSFDQKDLIE